MEGSNTNKLKDQDQVNNVEIKRIEDYHDPVTASPEKVRLSDKDLQDKADVYSRAMNNMDQFFAIQKLKMKYADKMVRLNDNRVKQDINYGAGERSRLPHTDHTVLQDDREWSDQEMRNEEVRKWKEEYDKDGLKKEYTLNHGKLGRSHTFNHAHNQSRSNSFEKDK